MPAECTPPPGQGGITPHTCFETGPICYGLYATSTRQPGQEAVRSCQAATGAENAQRLDQRRRTFSPALYGARCEPSRRPYDGLVEAVIYCVRSGQAAMQGHEGRVLARITAAMLCSPRKCIAAGRGGPLWNRASPQAFEHLFEHLNWCLNTWRLNTCSGV